MSYQHTDDPVADFGAWDEEQSRKEAKLPVCDYCGEAIQDDYYFDLDGCIICESCLNSYHRRNIEDYIE